MTPRPAFGPSPVTLAREPLHQLLSLVIVGPRLQVDADAFYLGSVGQMF